MLRGAPQDQDFLCSLQGPWPHLQVHQACPLSHLCDCPGNPPHAGLGCHQRDDYVHHGVDLGTSREGAYHLHILRGPFLVCANNSRTLASSGLVWEDFQAVCHPNQAQWWPDDIKGTAARCLSSSIFSDFWLDIFITKWPHS